MKDFTGEEITQNIIDDLFQKYENMEKVMIKNILINF